MYLFPCDENYEKMFPDVLIIGFKTNENLKLYLVRPFLPCVNEECRRKPEGGKRSCQLCNDMETKTLSKVHIKTKFVSQIKALFVVYLIENRVWLVTEL